MKNTQIKETAYALARKHGWELEYAGGLELDGEFLDDADLSWPAPASGGRPEQYVLNISWAETTAYGFTLTRETAASDGATSGSSFGAAGGFSGSSFGSIVTDPDAGAAFVDPGAFALQGPALTEKYYITTVADLVEAVEAAVAGLPSGT